MILHLEWRRLTCLGWAALQRLHIEGNKSVTDSVMPAKQAIAMHVSRRPPVGGMLLFSSFVAALTDARTPTGRDKSGAKVDAGKHGSWLGAIGCMALLDQIGTCFKPKPVNVIAENSIHRALN